MRKHDQVELLYKGIRIVLKIVIGILHITVQIPGEQETGNNIVIPGSVAVYFRICNSERLNWVVSAI